jgi:hypothetical protein
MMAPNELYVIQDNNTEQFLMHTLGGEPVFGELGDARTFTTMKAVKNQVTRFTGNFNVRYRKAFLTLED